jgi:excisionase family DNA binding protein
MARRTINPGTGHNQPPPDVFDGRLTVSIDETATALGVGRDTVYIMVQDGRLIASKFGARTVVHTNSIRQLLETTRLALPPRARARRRAAQQASNPTP